MKAYRFINVGGKTFYFNVNESKGGNTYLSVTAKQGNEPVSEKVVMFPNQIPSFLHCLIDTYAEVCRKEGIPVYFSLPFTTNTAPERVDDEPEPVLEPEPEVPLCPRCERKPAKYYDDRAMESVGSISVKKSSETGRYIRVRCQNCGWVPEGAELNKEGHAVLQIGSEEYRYWAEWAT